MVSSRGCDGPWTKRSLGALQELEAGGIGPIKPETAGVDHHIRVSGGHERYCGL
jgi:hypothetical protein